MKKRNDRGETDLEWVGWARGVGLVQAQRFRWLPVLLSVWCALWGAAVGVGLRVGCGRLRTLAMLVGALLRLLVTLVG